MNHLKYRALFAVGMTVGVLGLVGVRAQRAARADDPSLTKLTSITLLGTPGGGDYMRVHDGMLYVANTAQGTMSVIDCNKDRLVATIPGLTKCHGFAAAPGADKGYVTVGGDNTVAVISLGTHQVQKTIDVGVGPDAIAYAASTKRIFVGDHRGKAIPVNDPSTDKVAATVPVGGTVESIREDPTSGYVFANLEDTSEILALDAKNGKIVRRSPVAPGEGPTGLAVDTKNGTLFVGCGNSKLIVMNETDGKIKQTLPIGEDVDYAEFDPATGIIYTANGSGSVSVLKEDEDGKVTKVEDVTTVKGAHTLALDPSSHKVYVLHEGVVDVYQGRGK